jgi:hypothetical protein
MLSDSDAACGVFALVLRLRMYDSPLHQRNVQRKTTTRTPTSHEKCGFQEVKIVQNYFLLEVSLFDA